MNRYFYSFVYTTEEGTGCNNGVFTTEDKIVELDQITQLENYIRCEKNYDQVSIINLVILDKD